MTDQTESEKKPTKYNRLPDWAIKLADATIPNFCTLVDGYATWKEGWNDEKFANMMNQRVDAASGVLGPKTDGVARQFNALIISHVRMRVIGNMRKQLPPAAKAARHERAVREKLINAHEERIVALETAYSDLYSWATSQGYRPDSPD